MERIIKLKDLDEPLTKIDNITLYKSIDFCNDYYITILLRKMFVPNVRYLPVILDNEMKENFYPNNLENRIKRIVGTKEKIFSPIYKINVYVFELYETIPDFYFNETISAVETLTKSEYCIQIVKKSIWKEFTYTGIICVYCDNLNVLLNYFQEFFHPNIFKSKKNK
jgi:hypothetical protein